MAPISITRNDENTTPITNNQRENDDDDNDGDGVTTATGIAIATDTTTIISSRTPPPPEYTMSSTPTTTTTVSLSLMEKYKDVVVVLEEQETQLRLKYHPTLLERAFPLEVDEIKDQVVVPVIVQKEKDLDQQQQQPFLVVAHCVDASMKRRNVKGSFRIYQDMMVQPITWSMFPFTLKLDQILTLDVSHNEITELPGLGSLVNVQTLNLNRNWFNMLPNEIGTCTQLKEIIASRNFLRPNQDSLQLEQLKTLPNLQLLDLQYNQKCGRLFHRDRIVEALNNNNNTVHSQSQDPQPSSSTTRTSKVVKVVMTLWEELGETPGTYIGESAAVRVPHLLRSQLEPLGTVALRKRLVCDFHQTPTDPTTVDRAGVMKLLLQAYHDEGLASLPPTSISPPLYNHDIDTKNSKSISSVDNQDNNHNTENTDNAADIDYDSLISNRKVLYVQGIPVPQRRIDQLLVELRKWTSYTGRINKNRERPSIHANNYMILRKPQLTPIVNELATTTDVNAHDYKKSNKSRRAIRKAKRLERYRRIWELSIDALRDVGEFDYANTKCTEIAVTYGFKGSPHRDKQNCGPFCALSMGNFNSTNGGGGVVVEASARVTVNMNTHNKVGKIDGRYVHWVDEWDTDTDSQSQSQSQSQSPNGGSSDNTLLPPPAVPVLPGVERYSLIYYETGKDFIKPGPAVFSIPSNTTNKES